MCIRDSIRSILFLLHRCYRAYRILFYVPGSRPVFSSCSAGWEVSDPVAAPANAKVLEVGSNEEIGNFVVLDLGNEYTATCGQLKEITAVPGEYLEAGQVFGYVAEPTKYYSVEGVNVFFELKHQEKAIDPLDQME